MKAMIVNAYGDDAVFEAAEVPVAETVASADDVFEASADEEPARPTTTTLTPPVMPVEGGVSAQSIYSDLPI